MIRNNGGNSKRMRHLLVGPLPPSWGGARVSFKLFYDYLRENVKDDVLLYDVPCRVNRSGNPPGRVNHMATVWQLLASLFHIPTVSSVVVFGSSRFCFSYGLALLLGSKALRKRFGFRFFGGHPATTLTASSGVVRWALTRMIGIADSIVVQTEHGASEFPHELRDKITVIPGYRMPPPKVRLKQNRMKDVIKLVYTGMLSEEKGINLLLAAVREVNIRSGGKNRIELHCFGAGEEPIINRLVSEPNIVYHGVVGNSDLSQRLTTFDIFVFPSLYHNEGHSGAVIEALFAGLPVVASRLPGLTDLIEHGRNGYLVTPADTVELADCIFELCNDYDVRISMGEQSGVMSTRYDARRVLPLLASILGFR